MKSKFLVLYMYGDCETECSSHRTLNAAKKAAKKCENAGGDNHRIVKVDEIVPYKK